MKCRLSEEQLATYERDGFITLRNLFDGDELGPLQQAYRDDPTVNGSVYGMVDNDDRPHPICIWTDLGDDIVGMIPRMTRMVETTEALLGEPCYHWHSKITVKPPYCQANVDWHQDYGSWYDDGVLFPKMLTAAIALEPSTRANGCMQLIPGSHKLGRIDHRPVEGGPDLFNIRVEKAKETLGLVDCELDVGDAVFFDCNVLHGSGSNETDTSRLMIFASYNAASNEPVSQAQGANEEGAFMNISAEERKFRPLEKLPDDVLRSSRCKSAFSHTAFKKPRTDLEGTFSKANPMA